MLKDLLRYRAKPVRIGVVLMVLALLGLVVAYEINTSFTLNFWDKGYELKADFTDADGIANASDVRIAGTYVGQITQIRSVPGGLAEITIRLDKAHSPMPQGTKANLRLQTLLGTKFIELVPGPKDNPNLKVNSTIPTNSTQSPVDFDQFLASFDKPTRDDTGKLVRELGTATNGQGATINTLLANLHSASVDSTPQLQTFADRQTNLDSILVNLDNVGTNLSDNRQHLANVFTQFDQVLGTLAANDAGFRRFIEQGNIGLGHGINQFDGQSQNINDIFRLLNPTLSKLNPILVDVNQITINSEPLIQIVKQFSSDIASANSAYNSDTNNASNPGAGGWFLRQPVILHEDANPNNDCESKAPPAGSTCTGNGFNPGGGGASATTTAAKPATAQAPAQKPSLLPSLPLPVPLPKVTPPPLPVPLPTPPTGTLPLPPGVPGLTIPGAAPAPTALPGPLGISEYSSPYAGFPELTLFAFLLGAGG
ncbi:MAG: MlaD family protein [Candidatus Dormibacteria bacterium]